MRATLAIVLGVGSAAMAQPVRVVVDMDASRPGIQSTVHVAPGTSVVPGVAVYIYDPVGGRMFRNIGYIGGIDRGLAFGHMKTPTNAGTVGSLTIHAGTPANPTGNGWAGVAFDPAFDGPEVQYIETGSMAAFPTAPTAPIFTVDVNLSGVASGDVFRFFLADNVVLWTRGAHGLFTTTNTGFMDTGGDSVLDGTATIWGVDVDGTIAGSAFDVDFIDGIGGATITVGAGGCYANCDQSTTPPVLNVADFSCFLNAFASGSAYANCDASTTPPVLNVADFSCFLNAFAAGCS